DVPVPADRVGPEVEVRAVQLVAAERARFGHARVGRAGARADGHAAGDLVRAPVAVVVELVARLGPRRDAAEARAPPATELAERLARLRAVRARAHVAAADG